MKHIEKQQGKLLFERVIEILSDKRLNEKERIPKYRTALEYLYKELTKDARRYFGDLFARMRFVERQYQVPSNILSKVHPLRTFGNKVVHNSEFKPQVLDGLRCLYQLSEAISFFAQIEVPEIIKNRYSIHIEKFEKEVRLKRPPLPSYDFFAVVEDVFIPNGKASTKFCVLTCSTDEWGIIKLKLWNKKNEKGFGSDLTKFANIVEPFQYIYITEVKKHPDKEDEFFATSQSYVVLEPDYLIEAKQLSDCRQYQGDNPLLFILNRFKKGEITDRIMVGNIVGKMLDDMATDPDYSYKKSFETVMRLNSFGMLCMANNNGSYNNLTVKQVYLEAKDHQNTLQGCLNEFKRKQLIIEPTFISSKFGLHGRLDLMIEGSSNRKDIVELKSSRKYPILKKGLWPNHEAQTMCYDLLLSSTYPDRLGLSSILYSKAPLDETPMRNVSEEKYLSKQELLMLRNEVVAAELKLAKGDFHPLYDILSENFGPFPSFLKDQVSDFINTIKGLNPLVKSYFEGFLQFIYRELQVAKVGSDDGYGKSNGFADLWKLSKAEKIDNYNVLVYLSVLEVTDDYHIILEMESNLFTANVTTFRKGEIAILYPTPDPEVLNPLNSQILKCTILSIENNRVEVSLVNKQMNKNYFQKSKFWALDRDFRESSFKQMLHLSYQFLKARPMLINLVLGLEKPQFNPPVSIPKDKLNDVQHELVSKALAAKDYFLIQGPPGTGKTSKVLCQIINHISSEDRNLMVIAFTNRAVDEICHQLYQMKIDFIRLGRGDAPYYWSKLAGELKLDELYEKVGNTKVFISTQATFAGSLDLLSFKKFDTLIVDEASQLLEPQLIGIIKYFRRWILIGDENQLPAVVIQSEKDSDCYDLELHKIGLNNFRESLFSRLKKNAVSKGWNDCHGMLTIHYRMHSDIAEFPNNMFYERKLKTGSEKQKLDLPKYPSFSDSAMHSVFSISRVVFIPTKRETKSKINEGEAKLVNAIVKYVHKIYGKNFDQTKSIGVITPFRAQIATIKNELGEDYKNITVDTVERFQGAERDIIIISFALKSITQLKAIQSISEQGVDRKLNVAITRAKNHLVLLGTEEILNKNQIFKNLITSIKDKGGYLLNPLQVKSVPIDLF